ncbi:hypothetical protein KM043_001803 [Ampulex compressa]|nr:hypothetical protein KM043_001803 [Ampulex compressa]
MPRTRHGAAVPAVPLLLLIVAFGWSLSGAGCELVRNEDICGPHNGRRLYLELGEKGILYARNLSFVKNEPRAQLTRMYASNGSHDQCSLEFVTCPSCVIVVTFRNLALSHHCGDGGVTMDSPCRCDYVWISEPPYEDVSGTPFCGLYAPLTYRSSTRTLSITLLYSQPHRHAFTLEYTAERNRLHLKGTELSGAGGAKGLNGTGGGILTSPFFPARYPRDLGLEYVVTCPIEAPTCRIRLLFSDFQLATVSIIEFYDWNGQRLDVSSGARFRPPVIVSSGPSLLIRFYANGGTGLGYKAFYSFVIGHLFDKSVQPITDCGGYVENLGGAITMMDMVGEGVKTYDCVWLIRPPKNFLHMKTHMYLKVVTFADMAGNTELIVKQGPTSALLPLEVLRHPSRLPQAPRHRDHVAPVTSGFHVSLRGTFGPSSNLAIAYAAFSYMDCFTGSDFLCQNHRCIPSQLNCDGFDHCGDNSDEPATCFQDWEVEPRDRKWHVNKANYYFPKIDRYPDLKTATLVFVASSLGLIVLISALIILLYRMGARARQQRELQSRLQTISELLDGARIDDISVSDDPPGYEAPPGYDEVVKLGLETEALARKKRRSIARESRSRSSPNEHSQEPDSRSLARLVVEGASTSRGSQTTPIPPGGTSAVLPSRELASSLPDEGQARVECAASRPPCHREGPDESSRASSSAAAAVLGERTAGRPEEAKAIGRKAERPSGTAPGACLCEGACGCANEGRPAAQATPSSEEVELALEATPEAMAEVEAEAEAAATAAAAAAAAAAEVEAEETAVRPSRFLGWPGTSNEAATVGRSPSIRSACSTRSSTPCGALHRPARKLSVCSRDSYVTKISTLSSCNSYEKLQDEFEIISEAVSLAGTINPGSVLCTPCQTPRSDAGSRRRHAGGACCTSCDLESLYEGIKILDAFLARRRALTATVGHPRRRSVTVMLFGTPEHGSKSARCSRLAMRDTLRLWRSSEDALSN